jgi:hypothetical protein
MEAKLTLRLNAEVIEKAKQYAQEKNTSLSGLFENYLLKLLQDKKEKRSITPMVKSLSGLISLPKDFDHKKAYADYLSKKYS